MFLPWALLFGSLSPLLMCLCTCIRHPDVHTSLDSLLGSAWLSIFDQCLAYRKEQIALTALTIGKDPPVMRLARHLAQCRQRLLKESSILLATISHPPASPGSLHEPYGPPQ